MSKIRIFQKQDFFEVVKNPDKSGFQTLTVPVKIIVFVQKKCFFLLFQSFIKAKLAEEKEPTTAFFAFQVVPDHHTTSHETSRATSHETSNVDKNEVVKINFDDEARWAYWNGVRMFYLENRDYLEAQVGNPEGEDRPNKKFYDPRVWIRKAEETMVARCIESMTLLGSKDTYPCSKPASGSIPMWNFKPLSLADQAKKMMGLH